MADTTYLPVLGGFLFLVAIIDLYSRKGVGWSLGNSLDAELSGLALRRGLIRRQPGKGLVFHSDRGIEFAAKSFRKILAEAQMVQSMSRKGNSWDNAVAESFFSTLEFEGPDTSTWRYVADGEPELFGFIEGYYNQKRIHSTTTTRPRTRRNSTCAMVREPLKPTVLGTLASSAETVDCRAYQRTNSWHNNFRALRIRWEKTSANYLAFVHLACALICIQAAHR